MFTPSYRLSWHLALLFIIISTSLGEALSNHSISAVLVFGDSTVDSGNNNYIGTLLKANFPPYGIDFVNHVPTGRFTNGRLVTDFVASYIGIKDYVPPYLDPTLSLEEMMTGVCFASAGSGYDPFTAQISSVIPVQKQLEYFKEYKIKLVNSIGEERTKSLINNAAFLISAGTNDFVVNYYGIPYRRKIYNITGYQQFILQHQKQFIQGLINEGARLIALVGLPPMGCLPIVITLTSGVTFTRRACFESLNSLAFDYNQKLQNEIKAMQTDDGPMIVYFDIHQPLINIIQNPSQFGECNQPSITCLLFSPHGSPRLKNPTNELV
ncbi:unnamed protein product [Fraxinus pennsylvanica]|uniref:GDSL esterase/lipase n=1 Tax=Fraxinus pennsylvanica TaxID=56036 RepID=A0AAD1YV06_9LAMI|nr:unnamed protein product [Fraxinus pennsylvanica]